MFTGHFTPHGHSTSSSPSLDPDREASGKTAVPSLGTGLAFLVAALSFLSADVADAQSTVPGIQRDGRAAVAEYHARVFEMLGEVLEEWEVALREGELSALQEFYAEEAMLLLPDGTTLFGTEQISEQLASRFGGDTTLQVRPLDFTMSDRLAALAGRATLSPADPGAAPSEHCFSMVFRREGRDWKIRSHVFCELPEGERAELRGS